MTYSVPDLDLSNWGCSRPLPCTLGAPFSPFLGHTTLHEKSMGPRGRAHLDPVTPHPSSLAPGNWQFHAQMAPACALFPGLSSQRRSMCTLLAPGSGQEAVFWWRVEMEPGRATWVVYTLAWAQGPSLCGTEEGLEEKDSPFVTHRYQTDLEVTLHYLQPHL